MRDIPIIVGISGASGVIYGVELLKALKDLNHPAHLILSQAAEKNFAIETTYSAEQVRALAEEDYDTQNLAAGPASGSFKTKGMIVAPCSIKTLSAIANSYADNLLIRAADVTLKEKRPLVLMVRETPLHKGHLELMVKACEIGATILPPMPAFYHSPKNIRDIILQSVGKCLDIFDIDHRLFQRWQGE